MRRDPQGHIREQGQPRREPRGRIREQVQVGEPQGLMREAEDRKRKNPDEIDLDPLSGLENALSLKKAKTEVKGT